MSHVAPLTIIAEAAQGYEGKALLGHLLIEAAAAAGADAIKFQVVFKDDVALPGYRYYDWYGQLEMPEGDWRALSADATTRGLKCYADLSGERALALARTLTLDGAKIHSSNFFNHRFVSEVLAAFPRVFVSMGGIAAGEVESFIRRHRLSRGAGQVVFLFGFQAEPTPLEQNHLARLPELKRRLDGFDVGFMDHADGDGEDVAHLSVMAQALGVRVFEKHLTLDRALRLEDYVSALEPSRFAAYVRTLRRLDAALGDPALELTAAEQSYRQKAVKKLLASRELPAGHLIAEGDLIQKRQDADGLTACHDPAQVVGRRMARRVAAHQPLRAEDLA